jgi:SNF2 family DNA or RNA helicase
MIVLHAGNLEGRLHLWGETTPELAAPAPAPRGRRPKAPARARLPYDPGAAGLLGALREVAGGPSIDESALVTATIWLPTVNGAPLASTPLIAEPPEPGARATLAPWTVTAVPLATEEAVALLSACVGNETLARGVVVGKDLAFWVTAMRFAGALVARQQFLPGVTPVDETFRAAWEPIFLGADATRLAQLAKAMPHACRALARGDEAAPDAPASAVLADFLQSVMDTTVRSSVALGPAAHVAQRIVPRRRGRPRGSRNRVAAPRATTEFGSVHDQWLHALRSPGGALEGDEGELARFVDQIREWQRPVSAGAASPFRLCFRLEEPEENGAGSRQKRDAWSVQYLLQDASDPSLLVPAGQVWKGKGAATALLERGGDPREYMLRSLGQAAGIYPRIEASLRAPAPAGFTFDATGAHEFLTGTAWSLEQSGFGVLLPAWWTRKGTKQHLTARAKVKSPKMQGGSGLSLEEIVRFEWEVAIGDQALTLEELRALAKLKVPLVKIRGQWVQLNAEEIQAALDFWKQRGGARASVRDVVRMALGQAEAPGGLAFEGVDATGWVGDLLARLDGRAAWEQLPVPAGLRGELRPYQARGYSWLDFLRGLGFGACLADDMGLGKTIQTLALVQRDWESDDKRPVLLICPTSVVGNWQKEAARFTPGLPVMVHHGVTRAKGEAFKKQALKHAIVVSSYALLHRDVEILAKVPWAGVVLDEAQNVKNPETKQSRAARSLEADYKIALTGTPVENNVGDLWSIMEFLNPGWLGTQTEFKRRFFLPIQTARDPEAATRLKRLTGPFVLRRLKTDRSIIADLPDKMEMKVFCTLTREQASLYEAVVEEATDAIESAEGIGRKGLILATLSKLKQVCNHPAQFLGDNSAIPGRSGKLARLTEMLEEALATGDRALVFSQFAEMGKIAKRHLEETFGREVLFLHGAVPKKQRDRMVERFQTGDGPRVFMLSLKAGGTGLNLTAANHVFHFDRWWNPAVENQATDRAFRIGQTRNVQVHKFLCVGTLEEKIDEMIERKKEIAANVVGTGEGWLTELSTGELRDLFALRREAIGE